ncbi:MAG: orotidine-5'-phosphate decarboxylase [Cyclobacteriaceae bacterium]|nr:orotidine-5'-phosphate decarboxylase [Cyclobacteriaceae bacterium]
MTKAELLHQIKLKNSYLCVGLDTDITKVPRHLLASDDPIFEFNKQIIDATVDFAVAYKPNIAFYESQGAKGWESLQKTVDYIPKACFTIADAKRGDIGNTSAMYAQAFFEKMSFDSITVAPYMGRDSVEPFLQFEGKWVILLAYTSNSGSSDFQKLTVSKDDIPLYEQVISTSSKWAGDDQLMYVVGATHPQEMKKIRSLVPDNFLLVPGVGAQGGSLKDVSEAAITKEVGLLVNSSRGIIYASNDKEFASIAGQKAKEVQQEMLGYLNLYC